MNISICITVLNEENSIGKLLDSLLIQTKKPNEIVIVDGGSTDATISIIKSYKQLFTNNKILYKYISAKAKTRAEGRNIAVKAARNEMIAMTDAGCIADKHWLERITKPFINKSYKVSVVAGFYKIRSVTNLQKVLALFLGTTPKKFNNKFLPSARSISFRKSIWEKIGGFPENIKNAAEDTAFNYKIVKSKTKIFRVKNAIVEWGIPNSIIEFQKLIFNYSKGDVKTKIIIFPGKGIASHNIKAFLVLSRYILGCFLIYISLYYPYFITLLTVLFLLYFYWSYKKVFKVYKNRRIAIYGPFVQIASDTAVIAGFLSGILGR